MLKIGMGATMVLEDMSRLDIPMQDTGRV